MREVDVKIIKEKVKELYGRIQFFLEESGIGETLRKVQREIRDEIGEWVLDILLKNLEIAGREKIPYCQDTGLAVVFLEIGQEVHLTGGYIEDAINEGIREATEEYFLRKSVCDPFTRENTGTNTPAIVHYKIVEGDKIRLTVMAKGGGAENTSALKMLKVSDGWEGIKGFVLKVVEEAGPNACPPLVVGVGIGGNFETCAILSKKALTRPIGTRHPNPKIAEKEEELLKEINQKAGVGIQGLGVGPTALDVHIEIAPTHIASLPVAVNIQCHADRIAEVII